MGGGTDVAKEAGDIVILSSRLSALVDAWRLGRATLRRIRQNLAWAFMYNAAGIPIAAGLVRGIDLRPEHAALAMALSSVSVVVNSLALRWATRGIFSGSSLASK
jgi:Cu+-exporting ATPase